MHLSPPPLSFAVWRFDIKYLLLVLLGSAVGESYFVRKTLNLLISFKSFIIANTPIQSQIFFQISHKPLLGGDQITGELSAAAVGCGVFVHALAELVYAHGAAL